jgi:hypothetical protein
VRLRLRSIKLGERRCDFVLRVGPEAPRLTRFGNLPQN